MTCIDRFEKTIFSIKYHISRVKVLSFFFRRRAAVSHPFLFRQRPEVTFPLTPPLPFHSFMTASGGKQVRFFHFFIQSVVFKNFEEKKRISSRFKNKVDIFFCVIEAGLALQLISNFFVLSQSLFLGLINLRQQVLWPAISMK